VPVQNMNASGFTVDSHDKQQQNNNHFTAIIQVNLC